MASCCGHLHSAAVTEDGSLWTWGQGMQGELGLGKIDKTEPTCLHKVVRVGDRVVMVSAGLQHTAFLVASGVLWTYGRGNHGQLGLGDRRNRSRPTMVGRGAFGGAQMLMVSCGR
jgi:alpha-tubulin suppressor-like RCC1 family protein